MIPVPFEYSRASGVDEAVSLLTQHGPDAKLLSGGHSLLPLMKLRFASPGVLVDVWHVDELRGVRVEGDRLAIGATTTHHDVVTDPLVNEHCGVLAEVASTIADPQVRHRGTFGGALAHGDAAGDLPAVVLALEAEFVIKGPRGIRQVPAADFFISYLETALAEDEVLTHVTVPKLGPGWGWSYEKFVRTAQSWAVVGSCVLLRGDEGRVADVRIGLTNMGGTPMRAREAEAVASGGPLDSVGEAAMAAAQGTTPPTDQNADAGFRQHLAGVLTRRALERARARVLVDDAPGLGGHSQES